MRSGDRREVYGQEFKYLECGNCKRLVRGKCIRWGEDALDCPADNAALVRFVQPNRPADNAALVRSVLLNRLRTTQRSSASFCRTTRGQRCARPLCPDEPPADNAALVRSVLLNRPADTAALVRFVQPHRPADVVALVRFVQSNHPRTTQRSSASSSRIALRTSLRLSALFD